MATTYAELKNEIAAFTHRADLTSYLDTFIDFAEARMNRDLRVSQQETILVATATEYISLPADFLSVRVINLKTSPVQELQYIAPAEMDRLANNGTALRYYTILGDSIKLECASSTDVEMTYYASIPALSDSNTSNWMLATHPDVYLYSALAEAFNYTQNDVQAMKHIQLYSAAISVIQMRDAGRKSGNSMRVRVA